MPIPQNGQTLKQFVNSSQQIVLVCLTILWGWCLRLMVTNCSEAPRDIQAFIGWWQFNSLFIFKLSCLKALCKKLVLNILQNSQENSCVEVSFLMKLQVEGVNFTKKNFWCICFPVNFAALWRLFYRTHSCTYFYITNAMTIVFLILLKFKIIHVYMTSIRSNNI